ncbi:hypothetical protein ACH4TV_44660 [Streptomyces sp. NPDC020898]|uniref:hypothetical protein n=1 Tax=Streptomyces sp. NPDC020898 TaxID=3365101 RepID=UPI0037B39F40
MDEEEDRRLAAITPEITRRSIDLLRKVVGVYPEERIAQEALECADDILAEYGTDGLRILVMSLTGWAAVETEKDALASGRSLDSMIDDMMLTWLEANPED